MVTDWIRYGVPECPLCGLEHGRLTFYLLPEPMVVQGGVFTAVAICVNTETFIYACLDRSDNEPLEQEDLFEHAADAR